MIDLSASTGIAAAVDPETGRLELGPGLAAEERALRMLDAARDAYRDPPATAAPLYDMANGITPRERPEPGSELRYELTSLRPGTVGGEWVKTIGHIHSAAPDGLGYPEAYEVVEGNALFVLFRAEPLACLLVEAGVGDRLAIPPGLHHLAVNPGPRAMVFADVVARAVVPDYRLLRERRGAPAYLGPEGTAPNPRYPRCPTVTVRAADLAVPASWTSRLADHFFGDRGALGFLVSPAEHRDVWAVFEGALA